MKKRRSLKRLLQTRQMKKEIVINKPQCKGLYGSLIEKLSNLNSNPQIKRRGEYLNIRSIRAKICPGFSINKNQFMEILLMLKDLGFVEIAPNGIKVNFEVRENE